MYFYFVLLTFFFLLILSSSQNHETERCNPRPSLVHPLQRDRWEKHVDLLDVWLAAHKKNLTQNLSSGLWSKPFFFCNRPGNPQPQLQWFQDDKLVIEGLYIMTMIYDFTEREYHGCLQLDSPTHLNNGRYRLVAKNKFGMDQKEVEAHFMHQPWEGENQNCWGDVADAFFLFFFFLINK